MPPGYDIKGDSHPGRHTSYCMSSHLCHILPGVMSFMVTVTPEDIHHIVCPTDYVTHY